MTLKRMAAIAAAALIAFYVVGVVRAGANIVNHVQQVQEAR